MFMVAPGTWEEESAPGEINPFKGDLPFILQDFYSRFKILEQFALI